MEGEIRKVRDFPCHFSISGGTQSMGAVRKHQHSSHGLLDPCPQVPALSGPEQAALALHGGEKLVVVADNAAQVHGNHRLCPLGNGVGYLVIVHF